MRKLVVLLGLLALAVPAAIAAADSGDRGRHAGKPADRCGAERRGWVTIFDGSRRCYRQWRYAGGASMTLQRDGTLRAEPGAPGLGVLWYAARPYGDFVLKLRFRDDSDPSGARANSGVQVRFPAPRAPVPGCPTTFNGNEQDNDAWIAVNCGHEVQINDNPDGDPRKTGSIYGFADIGLDRARPVPRGRWSTMTIRVVGQTYTIKRDGVVINRYENVPGTPFPGRPNDPGSESRGLVGYIGLQSHGSPQDVVSFRDIRVKDLSNR